MRTKSRTLKIFAAAFVVLFALCCLVGFAACGDECEHENLTISEDESYDATCVEDGLTVEYCDDCGEKFETTIPATGDHVRDDGVVTKEADCGNAGETAYTCTECGETKTEALPAATGEHVNLTISEEESYDATCVEDGLTVEYCDDCGEKLETAIPATGDHVWDDGAVTKEATTESEGEMTYTCTVCGATKTQTTDKIAYMTDDDVVALVQALNDLDDYAGSYTVTTHFLEKCQDSQGKISEDEDSWWVYSYDVETVFGYFIKIYTDPASDKNVWNLSTDIPRYSLQRMSTWMDLFFFLSKLYSCNCTTVKECELVYCCWNIVSQVDFSRTGWGNGIEPVGDYVFEMTKTGNTYALYCEEDGDSISETVTVDDGKIIGYVLDWNECYSGGSNDHIMIYGGISYEYDESHYDNYLSYVSSHTVH